MMSNTGFNSILVHGDSAEVLRNVPDNYVDLVVTSPPYGTVRQYNGFTFDFEKVATELERVIVRGGVIVWVVSDQTVNGSESCESFKQALFFKETLGLRLHDTMIYEKHGPPLTHRRYEQAFEYMFVFSKGSPNTFNGIKVPKLYPEKRPRKKAFSREPNNSFDMGHTKLDTNDRLDYNVWKITLGGKTAKEKIAHQHPAIFPEELAHRHIITWSNEGDVVLDPFCGSGTTGKMALLNKRRFIGIDISKEYIALTKQRIQLSRDRAYA